MRNYGIIFYFTKQIPYIHSILSLVFSVDFAWDFHGLSLKNIGKTLSISNIGKTLLKLIKKHFPNIAQSIYTKIK